MKHGMTWFPGAALVVLMTVQLCAGAEAVPDLTKGETNKVDRKLTYNLGATGLRGWIYTRAANFQDSVHGLTTTASRQILVTHVGAKSPADGVFQVGDIIIGVNGTRFSDDARKSFGMAITEAEKASNKGVLNVFRYRAGKAENVRLQLRVMGTYSDTAPYDCRKSKLIFIEACKALEKEPLNDGIWGAVNGLALLSTGNIEYKPKVQQLARSIAANKLNKDGGDGCDTWGWGYKNLFLCEYYLATGDKEVLPGIKEHTIALARGQGMYGTFGHGGAIRTEDGKLHGSIPPYGPVNQSGLIANLSIVMGKKCGVSDPEVDGAIDRAAKFFTYFVGKGSIPYGEHMPWPYHENNGKNALTALMFSIQGQHVREAQFFAKMCTAAYWNREYGHTGQGFSYLWSALGANVGGPAAAAAFFKEAQWHFDLVRRCDGSFTYDGGEQYGAGRTDDDTYYGKSSYAGLSPAATYVLTYSMPLKKLIITGKELKKADWLSKKDVAEAIASGSFYLDRKKKSADELVKAFNDWSPVVRSQAAEAFAGRPEAKPMVPQLISMAEGANQNVRQGACEALGYIRDTNALPVLVRLLKHDDRWLRVKAANSLKNMGEAARPVLPDMLKAVVDTAEPLQPIAWDDPVQLTHGELADALFGGLIRNSFEGIDKKLLYPSIQAVSRNADGMARAKLRHIFENVLTLEDVIALGPDILAAIDVTAPADTMFGNEIRLGGLRALGKFHFKEAIPVSVKFARTQSPHGSESRMGEIMKVLVSYGTAARPVIPQLREVIAICNFQLKNGQFPKDCNDRRIASLEEAIKAIEEAKDQPELRSMTN